METLNTSHVHLEEDHDVKGKSLQENLVAIVLQGHDRHRCDLNHL